VRRDDRTISRARGSSDTPFDGIPFAVRADSARPHDKTCAQELLRESAARLPRLVRLMTDRGYRDLQPYATARGIELLVKRPPEKKRFVPIKPLVRVEQAIGWLGRWRRLSKCYEGTVASARTWLAVACVGQMLPRAC
jgi:hypothetical protein